mmetsp:Transcript_15019/g.13482  ORF Transcript_15019/g.13482 Transcript_15019/m.13482 type:complete len:321 (-) Transcript_15019:83-1045(-)
MAEQVLVPKQPSSKSKSVLLNKVDELITFINETNFDTIANEKSWAIDPNKKKSEFRNYEDNPRKKAVEEFYKNQHENVTYDFVLKQREKYLKFDKCVMTIWDMLHYLDQIVDESDPDTDLSQLEHALQTAEAARKAYPGEEYDWMHVTALIHDLGKVMSVKDDKLGFVGEPQWGTVGDIFPVGCKFSEKNVFYEYFKNNPDWIDSRYNTKYGVYSEKIGLENIYLSWSHDEYLYNIAKNQSNLPFEALCMLRYHSFYPWHTGGDYMYLCNDKDIKVALKWTKIFNTFDLYSKAHDLPKFEDCADYYKAKIEKYFPNPVKW